jgi:hypothetical protein
VGLAEAARGLVDALPGLATTVTRPKWSITTGKREELVVGIVPFADVHCKRGPVDGLTFLSIAIPV